MSKWDGHTHSEFCKHGSGEPTILMVERAIELGFTRYSITEHAPLPPGVIADPELASDFTLLQGQLPEYFEHIADLKKHFKNRIEILSGLEIDYVPGYELFFDNFIAETLPYLDDLLVSLHMMCGQDGICPIDYTPEAFEEGLLSYYGSAEEVHWAYWSTIMKMVNHPITSLLKKRIGHLGLINKYFKRFPAVYDQKKYTPFFSELFSAIKANHWDLDYNVAGLNKELFQEVYISAEMLTLCRKHHISLVYGSDAHGIDAVGQFYEFYLSKTQ